MLYMLQASLTLALLYSVYRLFLGRTGFHRLNRFVLIGIALTRSLNSLLIRKSPTQHNPHYTLVQLKQPSPPTVSPCNRSPSSPPANPSPSRSSSIGSAAVTATPPSPAAIPATSTRTI